MTRHFAILSISSKQSSPLHYGCYWLIHILLSCGVTCTLNSLFYKLMQYYTLLKSPYYCPYLIMLYIGQRSFTRSRFTTGLPPCIHKYCNNANVTTLESFPVPGCVAAGHSQLVWPDWLAGIIQKSYLSASHYCLPKGRN